MINKSSDILERLGTEIKKTARSPSTEFKRDENTAMPAELRNWLVRLPFAGFTWIGAGLMLWCRVP